MSPMDNVYFFLFYTVLFLVLYCTVPCEALGVSRRVQAR